MALDDNTTPSTGPDLLRPSGIDFETIVGLSKDAVMLLGLDGTPTYISPASETLFGWSPDSLAERLSDLVYVEASNPEADELHKILSGRGDPNGPLPATEVQVRSDGGRLVWVDVSTHVLTNQEKAPYAFAVFFRSIAKQRELEGLLEAASQTDTLTGLYNRRAFEENLKREWAVALREKTHTTLIKVTLDRFDALADAHGPGVAEDCLTKVADVLKQTARRPADITARTASSEFSLLLPRTHEMGAETISAYIQVAIEDLGIPNPGNTEGSGIVTASVGAACAVAEQTGISENADFIVAAAENCMFEARQEGGNRVKTVMNTLTR